MPSLRALPSVSFLSVVSMFSITLEVFHDNNSIYPVYTLSRYRNKPPFTNILEAYLSLIGIYPSTRPDLLENVFAHPSHFPWGMSRSIVSTAWFSLRLAMKNLIWSEGPGYFSPRAMRFALLSYALIVHEVEFCLANGGSHLFWTTLTRYAATHDFVALLDLGYAADVEANRGIELSGPCRRG